MSGLTKPPGNGLGRHRLLPKLSLNVTVLHNHLIQIWGEGMKIRILTVWLCILGSSTTQAQGVSGVPQIFDCKAHRISGFSQVLDCYADAQAIREARKIQTQALADEDVELVASFWTEDLTIRRALGHIVANKAEAVAIIQPTGDPATRVIFQRKSTKVKVSGNWPLAYEEGVWAGHLGGVDGPVIASGNYGAQWVKRDGEWYIRSEVFVALDCKDSGCDFQALP